MKSVKDRMIEFLAFDKTVREYLWPIANGEPVGPDGTVYHYGISGLIEVVDQMYTGEVDSLPRPVVRRLAHSSGLWEKGRAISEEERNSMSIETWGEVLVGLMKSVEETEYIRCLYCDAHVLANQEDFQVHYFDKCWDE